MPMEWAQTGKLDPASMPAAGLTTGHNTRVYNHDISHYQPFEEHRWRSNMLAKVLPKSRYPGPGTVDRSLMTYDIPGTRPRSRPGLGMGNLVAPNGMYTLRSSQRMSDPNRPDHLLPQHTPQSFHLRQWTPGPKELGQKTAGLAIHDIPGTSPKKSRAARKAYNSMDYSDVTGPTRWEHGARFAGHRPHTSLDTKDVAGARTVPAIFQRDRPGCAYDVIDRSWPTNASTYTRNPRRACNVGGYGLGKCPPPSELHHMFPRVGRETGPLAPVFTMPKARSLKPSDPNYPSTLGPVG
mmetsp:Transcript_18789/g.41113  ORF Transcript_18789/g.41113 Transcript_18789/m.41113 type:complete len:295 (-) Transcript_18789:292-1176(-)